MRINQYLARHTELSRRGADIAVSDGRVEINSIPAKPGDTVIESDYVTLDGHKVADQTHIITILFHKPIGYVVSRNGQGSQTIYDLLPHNLQHLNPVGRLDKDSSGLLLLTNNGELANQLTHPKYKKQKIYLVTLDKDLTEKDFTHITEKGVQLEDGVSRLAIRSLATGLYDLEITMHEGRNRQIRRTFETLGYRVTKLHRTHFGPYEISSLKPGEWQPADLLKV